METTNTCFFCDKAAGDLVCLNEDEEEDIFICRDCLKRDDLGKEYGFADKKVISTIVNKKNKALYSKYSINEGKKRDFEMLLKNSSIKEDEKIAFKFAADFLRGKHDIDLSSRIFLLQGMPGVGKTYLAERFIQIFNHPVLYCGCSKFKRINMEAYESLKELYNRIRRLKEGIIYIDDLNYVLDYGRSNYRTGHMLHFLMDIIDFVRTCNKRIILIMTSNRINYLEESIYDRIDLIININIPVVNDKLAFLKKRYKEFILPKDMRFLSEKSYGFNYRDLPEVIKIAYRNGHGIIRRKNLKSAIESYTPSALSFISGSADAEYDFSDVIGKEDIKKQLENLILSYKNKKISKKLGLKRHNLLIFDGPVGTGKTFMAEALAGELKFPFMVLEPDEFCGADPRQIVSIISRFSERFEDCVIVVDEAEKILGKGSFEQSDTPIDGYFNQIFGGIGSNVNAIVILVVNDIERFGMGIFDRFMRVRFELPKRHERKEFFMNVIQKAKKVADFNVDYDELARITQEMSFREMEKVCNNVFCRIIKGNKSVLTADFNDAVREIINPEKISMSFG